MRKTQRKQVTHGGQWKGWETIGGKKCYFKSLYEYNYACYLQWLKAGVKIGGPRILDWEYEPKKFWFDGIRAGVTNYTPDFKVTELNGKHHWDEVKGYMDPKSVTKLKRMKKYHPTEGIRVIDEKWFASFKWKGLVPGWKYERRMP